MAGIFICSDNTALAAELVGFAKKSGKKANIITFNENEANQAAGFSADRVYCLSGDQNIFENNAKATAKFLKDEDAELLLVGVTCRGRDFAARVAGYLDCAMLGDLTSLEYQGENLVTERLIYGGAVRQTETVSGMAVASVPGGKFEATLGGKSEIVKVAVDADKRVELVAKAPIIREGVDLTATDRIIAVGLGLEKQEDIQIAQDLADVMGDAGVGCTRAICEIKHWLPNYIGISGLSVKPSLYLSMGVSGQVQHIAGIRDAKLIVAVNNSENAPIFAAADYGVVGDLYEIIPMLTEAIKNK